MIETKLRKDKLRNKATVVTEVLKDPLATQDELVKKTGLGKGTVNRNMKELDQSGLLSESIDKICENDKELMSLVSGLNLREIKKIIAQETVELADLKTINDITDKSTRRYTLFKWTATDKDGGLKEISLLDLHKQTQ